MNNRKIDWWIVALIVLGLGIFLVLFGALLIPRGGPLGPTPVPSYDTAFSQPSSNMRIVQFL